MGDKKSDDVNFEVPHSNYTGSTFPSRVLCPKWIVHPCDYNECERVEALLRAMDPKRIFIAYFARAKCPPTCGCSYRFETDFPLDESKGQEKRVYCYAQEIISAAIENEMNKSRKPMPYEQEGPTRPVQEPNRKKRTEKTLTSLAELPDDHGTHHPHQHHGHDRRESHSRDSSRRR